MKKPLLLLVLISLLGNICLGQSSQAFEAQADTIFNTYDNAEIPGVASGIIKDGKVIYLKGFGAANMETKTLITPQTTFQLGELSKQFTTLAILLLEEQGIISLEEDIRKFIVELPEYEHKVTIAHLLNHTSGLHDIGRINTIINGNALIPTQEKAIELISAQRSLSFQPGSQFSFHEAITESVLMAEIVARSSGKSFPDFVKTFIFKPLGMEHSLIRDDYEAILQEGAEPYRKEEGAEFYKKSEVRSNVTGAINGYSSAQDLATWYHHFTVPSGPIGRLIQKLDTPVQLTNGQTFDYYWGQMTIGREFVHDERGLPIYWNFGLQGGYGSNIFRFMEEGLISFVIGNNDQYNGELAIDVLDHFMRDRYLLPPTIDYSTLPTVNLSTTELQAYEGNYWFQPGGYATKIFVKNDTLRNSWLFTDGMNSLVPISDDTFQQVGTTDEVRLYKFIKGNEQTTLEFRYDDSTPNIMKSYHPVSLTAAILDTYSGVYYNAAYKALVLIDIDEDEEELVVKNTGHQGIHYRPVMKDVFSSATYFMPALEFTRDESNKVNGLKIDGDGVHSLTFKKAQ